MTNSKPIINCCIKLVDSFGCVKMHGPTNPKFFKCFNFQEAIFRLYIKRALLYSCQCLKITKYRLYFLDNIYIYIYRFFCCGAATQRESWPPHSWGFLDHTQRCTTVSRTPLDERSTRRRDLYLTTHNIHSRQTSMSTVGFEPTISAGERPQTNALDRAATGTG